jgi:hypothetical protein
MVMVFDGAATSSRVAFFSNNNIQDILLVGTQSEKGNGKRLPPVPRLGRFLQ